MLQLISINSIVDSKSQLIEYQLMIYKLIYSLQLFYLLMAKIKKSSVMWNVFKTRSLSKEQIPEA